MKIYKLSILTLTALWLGQIASGETAELPALTVSTAIAEAIHSNAELRVALAHIETASGNVRAAASYPFNPEAIYTEGLDRHIGLNQTLSWPGKRALRESYLKQDIELAEIDAARFKTALASEVRTAFFELLAAREQALAAEEECEAARQAVTVASQRVEKNFAPPSEALKARTELINAERQLQSAHQSIVLAGLSLNHLLGRASEATPPALTGTLAELPSVAPLDTILEAALARHPDLNAQAVEIRKSETGVSLARKERNPDIGVEAFFEQNSRDTSEQKVGFGVTVPLPIWSAGGAGIASAQAARSEAELSLEKKRREVISRVSRAYTLFTGAQKDVALFSPELSQQLDTQSQQVRTKYAAGEIPYLVHVDLQQTRRNYKKDYADALLAVHRAWSELELAAGISLEELK